MSVIAKMDVRAITTYGGTQRKVEFGCVYDPPLATPENENQRFTVASPWGQMSITVTNDNLEFKHGQAFYIVFHDATGGRPTLTGAHGIAKFRCISITDFGGTSKQVELGTVYSSLKEEGVDENYLFTQFTPSGNLKMTVDNPSASIQFVPTNEYYLVFYPAEDGLPIRVDFEDSE